MCLLLTGAAIPLDDDGFGFSELQQGGTVKVRINGKTVLGRPIEYNNQYLIMLRRDGRMLQYQTSEIDDVTKVGNHFTPHSPLKLQEHYRKLFGNQYEVTRTRHYVVVHPKGLRKQWAEPFDRLHNRFSSYFGRRGYDLKEPEFPMVVVVFNSRSEFNSVARKDGLSNPGSYAGYYSPTSNWVVTFRGSSPQGDANWEKNETLIHEALHQYAFNRGIQQRWAPTPKWCAEGLASMFEAPGVNNEAEHRKLKDRLNPIYVQLLKRMVTRDDFDGQIRQLVSSDRVFDEDIATAYSLSWGLAFYLAESRKGEFNRYLQRIARRPMLANYTANDRIADFNESFGGSFEIFESHFKKYIEQLKL